MFAHRLKSLLRRARSEVRLLARGRRGIPVTVGGVSFLLSPESAGALDAHYEQGKFEAVLDPIRPGDVVFDLGAHQGLYTLAMMQRVGAGGRVVAFEPCPASFRVLRRNLDLNPERARVVLEPLAVAGTSGTTELWVDEADLTSSSLTSRAGRPVRVETVSLDDYCARTGLRPRHLKIDVEGAELDVLRGAEALLRSTPGLRLHLEVHAAPGLDLEELARFLRERGFSLTDFRRAGARPGPAGDGPLDRRAGAIKP